MYKEFSFRIKVKGVIGTYSFSVSCENGYVITNNYCPNALLVGEGVLFSRVVTPKHGETEAEFIQDCNNIVVKANANSDNDIMFCLGQAVTGVIIDHINRCGRLLFQDLLVYVDCFAYLLKAVGFSDNEIKQRWVLKIHFLTK